MSRPEQRLFFALWPGEEPRLRLGRLLAELPERQARPTHLQDLHITLIFLGQISAERRACIEQAADGVRPRPCDLLIDQLGYWPGPGILWCGPTQTPPVLLQAVEDLAVALRPCGIEPERRPYVPHITLARKAAFQRGFQLPEPIVLPVRDFVLVASQTEALPPKYRVLRRWPCAT